MSIVLKHFEIKAADLKENTIRGAAAVMGNLDRVNDVIYPKAFKKALPDFLRQGSVLVGHDWKSLPIAMPVMAKESGSNLDTEAIFHGTQAAQDARTVAMERLDKGLSVGLSIGFGLEDDDSDWFNSGSDLLAHAKGLGCDMDLFDCKGIMNCDGWCRGIKSVSSLYEYSIVPVPANPMAQATQAKGMDIDFRSEREIEQFLRDAGYSKKEAQTIISKGFRALRDAAALEDRADTPVTLSAAGAYARFIKSCQVLHGLA